MIESVKVSSGTRDSLHRSRIREVPAMHLEQLEACNIIEACNIGVIDASCIINLNYNQSSSRSAQIVCELASPLALIKGTFAILHAQ